MAAKKESKQERKTVTHYFLFSKENYKWMLVGLVLVIVGFLLMVGGKSNDPKVFNAAEVYSFRRITLAPVVIIAGLVLEVYAIMCRPTKAK